METTMIYKTSSPNSDCVRVVFELPASLWADRAFLVGDFNGWDSSANPFRQNHDGVWRAVMDLPARTRHEFGYLIDGEWHTDFHADGWSENAWGMPNGVIETTVTPAAGTRFHLLQD
jgi:1,4-alpha-glucan branching enzyme